MPDCLRSSALKGRSAKPNLAGPESPDASSAEASTASALPMVAVNDRDLPSRQISSEALSPGVMTPTRCDSCPASRTDPPLTLRITAPTLIPALSAALSGVTLATNATLGVFNLKDSESD